MRLNAREQELVEKAKYLKTALLLEYDAFVDTICKAEVQLKQLRARHDAIKQAYIELDNFIDTYEKLKRVAEDQHDQA
jgi:hypothetical protein